MPNRVRPIGFHTGFNNFSAGKPGKNDLDFRMLKICSKLLISCCIISFFAFGCKKNTENPSDDGIMGYINNIKDKDGIDLNSIDGRNLNPHFNEFSDIDCAHGDTAVLWGLRNNKLWLSFFNNKTKQQLIEWNSSEEVTKNIKITINKGYGESETFYYDTFSLYYLHYTPFGYIGFCQYRNQYYGTKLLKDWFIINNENIYFFNTSKDDKIYQPKRNYKLWYNNSVIISFSELPTDLSSLTGISDISNIVDLYHLLEKFPNANYKIPNLDRYTCVINNHGETICRLKDNYIINSQPLSYTDGISLSSDHITRHNSQTGEDVWCTHIPSLADIESDARVNTTIVEQGTLIWKYQIDITNRDGSKKRVVFTVNVETGEVTEL